MSNNTRLILIGSSDLIPGECYVRYFGAKTEHPIPETDMNYNTIKLMYLGKLENGNDQFKIYAGENMDDLEDISTLKSPIIIEILNTFKYEKVDCLISGIERRNLTKEINNEIVGGFYKKKSMRKKRSKKNKKNTRKNMRGKLVNDSGQR